MDACRPPGSGTEPPSWFAVSRSHDFRGLLIQPMQLPKTGCRRRRRAAVRRKGYDVKLRRTPHTARAAYGTGYELRATPAQRDQRDHPRRSGDISGKCHPRFLPRSQRSPLFALNVPIHARSTICSPSTAEKTRQDLIAASEHAECRCAFLQTSDSAVNAERRLHNRARH